MVDELVNPSVIGTNVGFCELPNPAAGGVDRWCDHLLRPLVGPSWWKAKLDGYGLESTELSQEENGSRRICFSAIKGVYTVEKREVDVVIVNNEQLIFIQCLLYSHATEMGQDVLFCESRFWWSERLRVKLALRWK